MIAKTKLGFFIRRSLADGMMGWMRLRNGLIGRFDRRARFYAEFFTDKYIRQTFFSDFSFTGTMVEVGCATPKLLSMSQHFRETGWRCIGIEPNPGFVALHRDCGNEVYQYAAADFTADDFDFVVAEARANYSDSHLSAHSYSSLGIKPEYLSYKGGAIRNFNQSKIKVSVRRLDDILSSHCPEVTRLDFIAIDVEGYELEVMKGFTPERYQTKVIVMENLFHKPEYSEYMDAIGYKLHSRISYNYIYQAKSRTNIG